jgi:hypothetical protein
MKIGPFFQQCTCDFSVWRGVELEVDSDVCIDFYDLALHFIGWITPFLYVIKTDQLSFDLLPFIVKAVRRRSPQPEPARSSTGLVGSARLASDVGLFSSRLVMRGQNKTAKY